MFYLKIFILSLILFFISFMIYCGFSDTLIRIFHLPGDVLLGYMADNVGGVFGGLSEYGSVILSCLFWGTVFVEIFDFKRKKTSS